MKQYSRLSHRLPFLFLMVLSLSISSAQSAIKVHKSLITVSPPDKDGQVTVRGAAGSIRSDTAPSVKIINLSTHKTIPLPTEENGSFQVTLAAQAGQKIRIMARNQTGKLSVGTFTIPPDLGDNPAVPQQQPPPTQQSPPPSQPPSRPVISHPIQMKNPLIRSSTLARSRLAQAKQPSPPPTPIKNTHLAVIITVVNTSTNEIVAVERVTGPTRAKIEQQKLFGAIVDNIINRCAAVVKAELSRYKPLTLKQPRPTKITGTKLPEMKKSKTTGYKATRQKDDLKTKKPVKQPNYTHHD